MGTSICHEGSGGPLVLFGALGTDGTAATPNLAQLQGWSVRAAWLGQLLHRSDGLPSLVGTSHALCRAGLGRRTIRFGVVGTVGTTYAPWFGKMDSSILGGWHNRDSHALCPAGLGRRTIQFGEDDMARTAQAPCLAGSTRTPTYCVVLV